MSKYGLTLLKKQLHELQQDDSLFSVELIDDDFFKWEIWFAGPQGTLYENGSFHAILNFPEDFPNNPPTMKIQEEMWHPNIYPDGTVCISILHPPGIDALNEQESADERWRPILGVETILVSVMSLLGSPNLDSPANVDAAIQMKTAPDQYKKRVRQLVEKTLEWRTLEAVEMGQKNHELVPVPLIAKIANLRRAGISGILGDLLKHKLLSHDRKIYDGYKLTYLGYDFLALRAFSARNHLKGVGMRMGVGKESDIHICEGSHNNQIIILKLHRLGRVSFRSIKRSRDYLGNRQSASWMYMARLAAAKEFAYMKALYEQNFPVPKPIDVNRHGILMEYIDAFPLSQIKGLENPRHVLEDLMTLIVRMAESGLIHGDFNEFNLMISEGEKITMIDFPQIVSTQHPNAKMYFDRDVECVRQFFRSRFGIEVTEYPKFEEMRLPEISEERSFDKYGIGNDEEARLAEAFKLHQEQLERRAQNHQCEGDETSGDDRTAATSEAESDQETDDADQREQKFIRVEVIDEDVPSLVVTDLSHHEGHRTGHQQEDICNDVTTGSSDGSSEDSTCEEDEKTSRRLDNVWRPTVKKRNARTARKHAVASEKKKRSHKDGNTGFKKNKEIRKLKDQIKHEL